VLDLVIRGGSVVDGTGRPQFTADVGISEGQVVSCGRISEQARREIDADGLVVAPGFVDIHTHYDVQVLWDPALTPSSCYGVTTVIAGNCGFSIAPLSDAARPYVMRMLARVEGMPLDALLNGPEWDWHSTDDYLRRVESAAALNIGFMAGHSTIRRVVMGEDATRREATEDEIGRLARLLRQALADGCLGFSSSLGLAHVDDDGVPVPSRHASSREFAELASVCSEFDNSTLELIPGDTVSLTDDQIELMADLSVRANSPLNWNVLRVTADTLDDRLLDLRASGRPHSRVVALTMPIPSRARFSFRTAFVLDGLPGWAETMSLPAPARLTALGDPSIRQHLLEQARNAPPGMVALTDWGSKVILETEDSALRGYEGRLVADIAAEEAKSAFDALLDLVCRDHLATTFGHRPTPLDRSDWEANVAVWRSGAAVIGASDAGAHLDFTLTSDYPAYVLQHAVRHYGVISLEEAIHYMTAVPADLYRLGPRGRITIGGPADIVIFDATTIASGEIRTRFDLPGGHGRLYSEPVGVHHVLVNGSRLGDQEAGGPTGTVLKRTG
jgi:N-acyl-D-aspartate/D-glutamate deacylase